MAAPKGNRNAEKWTLSEATELFDKALLLSESLEYDFIGEIAKKLKTHKSIFTNLVNKFPELQDKHNMIIGNCEANCFCNSKKGKIREATAIVNLKSNHGWTDRVHEEHSGKIIIDFTTDD